MELLSLNRQELRKYMESLGHEPFRADQILKWVYKKFTTDFSSMSDVPKKLREELPKLLSVHCLEPLGRVPAPDAVKYMFRTRDGHLVETVLIKERDHLTLCVSSQVGCAVGCTFCATAVDGLRRNLEAHEILDQFLQVQKDTSERIRNVVFMGMGEPLANYENVKRASEVMVSPWGLDLSKRRITISTSGLIRQLEKMASDRVMKELNLAVSLNAPSQELRERIMPIAKTNPLKELMRVLVNFPLSRYRRITLEYVLIKDLNDGPEHSRELVRLIGKYRKRFKVNLIPYNPDPVLPYERPTLDRVYEFQKVLWKANLSALVRFSKGADVFGACGQLRNRSVVKFKPHGQESEVGR